MSTGEGQMTMIPGQQSSSIPETVHQNPGSYPNLDETKMGGEQDMMMQGNQQSSSGDGGQHPSGMPPMIVEMMKK